MVVRGKTLPITKVIALHVSLSGCRQPRRRFWCCLVALIKNADAFLGPGILVPTRNAGLFRWCLESGLRVVQPMTLMTIGLYNEPAGTYLPSILY